MRITTLFLFFSTIAFGQEVEIINTNPSLINFDKAMAIDEASEIQIDSMFGLIEAYSITSADTCLLLSQQAIAWTKTNPDKKDYAYALILAGVAYGTTGDQEKGEQFSLESKAIAESIGDEELIGRTNTNLGSIAYGKGDYEAALDYFIQSAKSWERIGDKLAQARAYNNIGAVFFNMNDFPKVQEYAKRSKAIAEELDDDELRVKIISSEGIDLMTYGIHYFLRNEADTLNQKMHLDTLNLYFEKSDAKFAEALKIARKAEFKDDLVSLLNNYVALSLNMEKFDKALSLALEAENIAEKLGDLSLLLQCKFNLGSAYTHLGKYEEAAKYGEESLSLAKEKGFERKAFLANRMLYDLYKETGKYDKANIMLEEKMAYQKKIGDVDRTKAISEVEAQYQTVKKEKQILELAATNAKIQKQRNMILGSALSLSLLGFLGFRFNKVQKDRNDKKAFAEALIFAQETERKRIARDLHDGVGQSLLLIKKQLATSQETTSQNNTLINDTLEEVRNISRNLHPFQLEKFGLTTAINDVIERVEKSTDLFISKEIENIDGLLSGKDDIHYFRVIQEALNNIIKHANASAAKITIEKVGNSIVTKIMDNGKGFDHELTVITSKSLGLRTMSERISTLGGRLKIETNKPTGTMVNFTIPKTN